VDTVPAMAATFVLDSVAAGPADGPILRSVTVEIPCEGITVLAGPSGSGKSTLLRLLNRLDDPLSGTISLEDRPLPEWVPNELRRRVAMVFQRPPLFPGTVEDNLRVAVPDMPPERAGHVLRDVGLSAGVLNQKAVDLSGGEAQRMAIARALLTEPEFLLADEPTAALDGAARRTIEVLGREVAASGIPIVWVTHDTEQLRRLADHVLLLADGEVRAFGRLDDLDASDDPLVRELVGAP
jgi:putative ABC transport system ATP-binding protein